MSAIIKDISFDRFGGSIWPSPEELRPYFFAPRGKEWFHTGGNDTAGLAVQGLDGTEHLHFGLGRIDNDLSMWGMPGLGVLLIYSHRRGAPGWKAYTSKGDLSRLKELVSSLHDTPLPVGLFIPFDKAWRAVKEFMETEGQLPTCIEWVNNADLPPGMFPDP